MGDAECTAAVQRTGVGEEATRLTTVVQGYRTPVVERAGVGEGAWVTNCGETDRAAVIERAFVSEDSGFFSNRAEVDEGFEDVARELQRSYPPRHRQGFTLFFTGLSGSGKSTIANILRVKFLEMGGRPVTLLDGDLVRKHLSSELGFSKEHRDLNIRRIGFVASEITKNGGIAICAPIAPYDSVRKEVRAAVQPGGGFVLVHLSTGLPACESRDRKGLYAKARAGLVQHFTGISDPYEEPTDAEVVIDTTDLSPEEAAQEILLYLERQGYIGVSARKGA